MPPGWVGPVQFIRARLKKYSDIFCQQNVLIEYDLSLRDLPMAVDFTQHILPLPDKKVGLVLKTIAVDQHPALDGDLRRGPFDDLHVGDHMADP